MQNGGAGRGTQGHRGSKVRRSQKGVGRGNVMKKEKVKRERERRGEAVGKGALEPSLLSCA